MRTPASLLVARFCVAVQVVVATTAGVVAVVLAAAVDTGAGDYAGLEVLISVAAAVASFVAALAVGIPAVLVRRHDASTRTTLVVAELLTGACVAGGGLFLVNAHGQDFVKIVLGLFLAAGIGAAVALIQPSTVAFTADRR